MKKFVAILVVIMLIGMTAVAEMTHDECVAYMETWDIKEYHLSGNADTYECWIIDATHYYHVTIIVVHPTILEEFGSVQFIVCNSNGWFGSWYSHDAQQLEEDMIEVVSGIYEGSF